MLHKSFKPAKCKTSLRLAIPRIRLLKNKKDAQIKQLKGELAKLLENGQDRTARIRVEHLVREEKTKEAYELIEIYCELIVARMPIIESQKNCPPDLKEAVTSVIFASPRCADIPELMDVRKQLTAKYGKEFTSAAVELRLECGVSRMLVEKLSPNAPDGPTKMKILTAIAKEYNVKWESEVFEEKVAMPPTDLLNGPSTFEKASRIQMEPIEVQVPIYQDNKGSHNLQFPAKTDKNHDKPTDFNLQNPVSSPHSRMSSSNNISINPEVRRSEFRYSPSSGKNWNMEFKDATSAAQAAAESAEIASMAARAAAELSIRGKMTQHYSSPSQNSSAHKLRNEIRHEFSDMKLANEHVPKDPVSTTSHGRSSDRDAKFSYSANYSDTEKHMYDNSAADNFEVADKYPEMMPSEPEMNNPLGRSSLEKRYSKSEVDYVTEQPEFGESESSLYIGEESIGKESSRRISHSQRSLSNDDVILDDNKSGRDAGENPFANDDHNQDSVGIETSLHVNAVVFDESASDDDYDVESKHQTRESSFNCLSPDRKSKKNNTSFTNPSPERPMFSESLSSMGLSQKDDLLEVTFDHSDGPSSESEEEMEKFKLDEDVDPGKYPSKQSVDFINPELSQSRYFGLAGSSERVKLVNSSLSVFNNTKDEERDQSTRNSSKVLLRNEVNDNIDMSGASDTEKDTQSSAESSLESVKELNFEKLRGGFRNKKGYIRPSYVKNPSGNALSFRQSSENSKKEMEKEHTPIHSSTFGHNRELYNRKTTLQVGQKPSLRFSGRSDQNDDDSEDEFSDHSRSREKVAMVMEGKTSKVAVHYSDSDEDLPEQTISNQPRQNFGVSRRTKGSSSYTGSSSRSSSTPDYEYDKKFPARTSSEQSSKTEKSRLDTQDVSKTTPEPRRSFQDKERKPSISLPKIATEKRIESLNSSRSSSTPDYESDKKFPTRTSSEQSSKTEKSRLDIREVSKTAPEPRRSFQDEERKPLISLLKIATEKRIESLNSSSGETPSSGKSAHVHPKLPDYDSFTAHFQALRKSR